MTFGPRAKLLALVALFLAPIGASLYAYYVVHPGPNANYGELIPPHPAGLGALRIATPPPADAAALEGHWVLVAADATPCAVACVEKLATMRQVRLALGRNASRVARLLVVDGGPPDAALLADGLVTGRPEAAPAADDALRQDRGHIYLVDPRGDVMLRWPAAPDRKRMLKDLERLLRASQIG